MPFAVRDDLDLAGPISMLPESEESVGLGSSASIFARNKARWDKYVMTGDNGKPFWYMQGPDPWVKDAPNNKLPFGSAAWVTWIVDYVRSKKDPSVFPEPPFNAPVHGWSVWAQAMFRNFGLDYIPEPPKDSPKYKVWADARYRATHTGGFLGGVARTFRQIGSVVITAVGAVLAPFTGGASLAAASIATAAIKAVQAKQAATAAKSRAAADAAQLQADANRQQAALALQVDKFYKDNTAWFLQHGVTSEKWAKLTLDQKIDLINAGSAGKWPEESQPVAMSQQQQVQYLQQTAAAAQRVGIPAASVVPEAATPLPPPPPPGVSPEEARAVEKAVATATYEVFIEGHRMGQFQKLSDAAQAALSSTSRGDRFEVFANGASTGLRIRTSDSSIEAPMEDKVRALSHEEVVKIVDDAEKSQSKGGGFPWWLILAGGAAAAVSR